MTSVTHDPEEVKKTHQRRLRLLGLKIHWIVFLSVNLLLFLINYLVDYSYPWHLWPLMGWGIGIFLHSAIVIILNMFRNGLQISLAIHASTTLIMSSYLIWSDWFTDFRIQWVLFAVVPLLLIWLNHFGYYKLLKKSDLSGKRRIDLIIWREYEKLLEKGVEIPVIKIKNVVINRIILQNHIIIYAVVNIFLFLVNLYYGLDYLWFLWPTLSWGLNILFHALIYVSIKKRTLGQKFSIKLFLTVPVSLCVYLFLVDFLSNGQFNWFWWAVVPIIVVSLIIALISQRVQLRRHAHPQVNPPVFPPPQVPIPPTRSNVPQQEIAPQSRYCPNCGKPLSHSFQFCDGCGFRVTPS